MAVEQLVGKVRFERAVVSLLQFFPVALGVRSALRIDVASESDVAAVRRPFETGNAGRPICQGIRLSAFDRQQPDLSALLLAPLGDEGYRFAIWREYRIQPAGSKKKVLIVGL